MVKVAYDRKPIFKSQIPYNHDFYSDKEIEKIVIREGKDLIIWFKDDKYPHIHTLGKRMTTTIETNWKGA